MENIIILRSPFKIPRAYLNPARNPHTNRYPESVRRVDGKGEMILSREDIDSGRHFIAETDVIEIWDGKTFDLDDDVQNSEWESIKYHKIICWGDLAERAVKVLDKGNITWIEGELSYHKSTKTFMTPDGDGVDVELTNVEVKCLNLQTHAERKEDDDASTVSISSNE